MVTLVLFLIAINKKLKSELSKKNDCNASKFKIGI